MGKTVTFPCAHCGKAKTAAACRAKALRGRPRYCSIKCAMIGRHPDPYTRFLKKVRKTDGCWEWLGHRQNWGYGQFWLNGKLVLAHRFAYEHNKGPVPSDKILMHSCDNPGCVNPGHLSIDTLKANSRDCATKGRSKLAKLSIEKVRQIRKRTAKMVKPRKQDYAQLAEEYGVKPHTIYLVAVRKTWAWV